MKRRFILYRRKLGGVFYVEDTETRKQESLGTKNRAEAMSLLNARNESVRQPQLNLQIAKHIWREQIQASQIGHGNKPLMPSSKPKTVQPRIAGVGRRKKPHWTPFATA